MANEILHQPSSGDFSPEEVNKLCFYLTNMIDLTKHGREMYDIRVTVRIHDCERLLTVSAIQKGVAERIYWMIDDSVEYPDGWDDKDYVPVLLTYPNQPYPRGVFKMRGLLVGPRKGLGGKHVAAYFKGEIKFFRGATGRVKVEQIRCDPGEATGKIARALKLRRRLFHANPFLFQRIIMIPTLERIDRLLPD
jgi:hypothetical protein